MLKELLAQFAHWRSVRCLDRARAFTARSERWLRLEEQLRGIRAD